MQSKTIDSPNEKQKLFMLSTARYIGYGGSRGGGKSWAVRKKAMLLALNYAGINILLLRRTFPELRANHIRPLLVDLHGVAIYKESEKIFAFPNGSVIKFGYCDSENDVNQYQGQEYDVIFMDEATQFTEYQFNTLTACNRGANDFPKRFYLPCNPGGVGHAWVKRLFIDRIFSPTENPNDYVFIPARIYDNKVLLQKDPDYLKKLQNLPEKLRRAWLDGDWNIFDGQYFSEFSPDIHIMPPFAIPEDWRRYFVMDYGLDMLAAYWIAVDWQGRAYVYRECYEGKDNNMGANQSGHIVSEAIRRIRECMPKSEKIDAWFAPPDLWSRKSNSGDSTAELFHNGGIPLVQASNDREMGWLALREWLKLYSTNDGDGLTARLRIFACCPNLIRTLPSLQFDKHRPNDCATTPHELTHAPDALRYFVSARPTEPQKSICGEDNTIYENQVNQMLNFGV